MKFGSTTYNTEELFLKFIDEELVDALGLKGLPLATSPSGPRNLLLMDVFAGHTASAVLDKLRDFNILPSLFLADVLVYYNPSTQL